MSFIVQCLCVCLAAPRPHLPSLLITAHYREVKQINQKALIQSLPRHTLARRARLGAHTDTGPRSRPCRSEGHCTARLLGTGPLQGL